MFLFGENKRQKCNTRASILVFGFPYHWLDWFARWPRCMLYIYSNWPLERNSNINQKVTYLKNTSAYILMNFVERGRRPRSQKRFLRTLSLWIEKLWFLFSSSLFLCLPIRNSVNMINISIVHYDKTNWKRTLSMKYYRIRYKITCNFHNSCLQKKYVQIASCW